MLYKVIIVIACILAVSTIVIMYRQEQKKYIILKTLTSAGFLAVAISNGIRGCNMGAFVIIMPGLIFCFMGDVFLAFAHEIDNNLKKPWFTLGAGSFTIAQLLFSWELLKLINFQIRPTVVMALVIMLVVFFTSRSRNWDYGDNKVSSIIYGFLIGLFCGLGLNYICIYGFTIKTVLMGIGACLFLTSDFTLSCKYFKKNAPACTGVIVLVTYYLAVYMIAFFTGIA